jgi:TetR/AcrR family transcriptional repressor of nem operon
MLLEHGYHGLGIQAVLDACLEEARADADLPADTDTGRQASLLVDCWEGAAHRNDEPRAVRPRGPV